MKVNIYHVICYLPIKILTSFIFIILTDYSSISEELKERVCDGTVIDIKSQGPVKFSVWVSFAEIYNEYVYDLLDPTPLGKGKKRPTLKLGDDKKGNPYIKGRPISLFIFVILSLQCRL